MFVGIGMHAPGKVPRQLAQSPFGQRRVRKELVPPRQQPPAGLAQRKVAAHGNAIRAVVGAAKPIRHVDRQVVRSCHVPRLPKPAVRRQGEPLFPSAVWEKACITIAVSRSYWQPRAIPLGLFRKSKAGHNSNERGSEFQTETKGAIILYGWISVTFLRDFLCNSLNVFFVLQPRTRKHGHQTSPARTR